jgi:hypothetical protein
MSAELTSTALVACDGDQTRVAAASVRTRSDGVHVLVTKSSGEPLVLNYTLDDGSGGGGDMIVPKGTSEQVVPFVAESVGFKCLRQEDDDEILDFALDFEAIDVVDPQGLAKAAQPLDCGADSSGQGEPPPQAEGSTTGSDPIRATKSYLRSHDILDPGDVVEAAVSPASDFPIVRFVRDGRLIGAFWFAQVSADGDLSLDVVQLCPEVVDSMLGFDRQG